MRYRSDDIPPFRLHKASGRGYVHLDGQRRCLARIIQCAVKGVHLQRVRFPPGKGSLQPVAIGATAEATKPSKPLV